MELLKKSEIFAQKIKERRIEIDEGAKLAQRIDSLRSTAARESEKLRKFRDESLAQTKKEIDALISKKAVVQRELEVLEENKRIALLPLDKEKKDLEALREEVTAFKAKVSQQQVFVNEDKRQLRLKNLRLDESDKKTKERLSQAEDSFKKAKELEEENRKVLALSKENLNINDTEITERNKSIDSKEALVLSKERECEIRTKILDDKEKELNLFDQQLKDRYQTLLRTEKYAHSPANN